MQVNSKDEWNRHRIEGYGFVRLPKEPGYHKIEVSTWRPRASIETEIHSFFLGGSVRIQKLEELTRTQFINSNGYCDIVNRFGLETEDAGKIQVNLNICTQDTITKKTQRRIVKTDKEKERLETRKLVMKYQLDIKNRREALNARRIYNDKLKNTDNDYEYNDRLYRQKDSDSEEDGY